jgi:ribosomal 50S subunit-recycling heat shock protein
MTIQLQSIGTLKAQPANNIKIGDVLIWNFGAKEIVKRFIKVTAKTILIEIESENGKLYERRLLKTRAVAIK